MADVSVQNERINGWIPSSATNVILNWPERIKTQPHDDRDNCFLPFDSKGPCGMTVNNDIDDDSATKHGDSHKPHIHLIWRESRVSLLRIAARATTFSEFARGDETGVDVNTTCAEEAESSGHDLAQCGGFVIFHTSCTDPFRCSTSCPCCPCRRTWNPNFCVRICTCPLELKCPLQSVYKESLRCVRRCGHLWHPFPLQPRCR